MDNKIGRRNGVDKLDYNLMSTTTSRKRFRKYNVNDNFVQ